MGTSLIPIKVSRTAAHYAWVAFALTVAFTLLAHGGLGYNHSRAAALVGALILASLSLWWLIRNELQLSRVQLGILLATLLLMYWPAMLGLISFRAKAGFTFIVLNLLCILLFSQIMLRYEHRSDRVICATLVISAVVNSLMALVLLVHPVHFVGLQFGREGYFRLVGVFSTPNRFGEVTAVGVLASTYLFSETRQRHRVWFGALAVTLALFALASGSKGVLLGLTVGFMVMLIFTRLIVKKTFLASAVVLIPLAAWGIYRFYDYIVLATKLDRIQEGRLDVGSGRLEIWAGGVDIFSAAPVAEQLFGQGATAFVARTGVDAHSMFLHLLVEYGIVSIMAIAALALYLGVALLFRRHDRRYLVLGASLIAFCLARGVSMPTILKEFNFAMIAFWAGVSLVMMSSWVGDERHA